MRVLLDENLPHDFRHFLPEHEVFTVAYQNWQGLRNGELLDRAASDGFEVFITKDAGIRYEQDLKDLPLAFVVIRAPSHALDDLLPHVPSVFRALNSLQPCSLVVVGES